MSPVPPFAVQMDIENVLYLSYLVPENRLRASVPADVSFGIRYGGNTILSVVIFHSKNVRTSFLPILRFAYNQANIRTYILDPATRAPSVFFLRSGITSRFIAAATGFLGIPWQPIAMSLDARYGADRVYRYCAEGRWDGDFRINLMEGPEPVTDTEPFRTPREAIHFLTGPTVGFYGLPSALIRFEAKHSAMEPLTARIREIRFPMLVDSGLLAEEELQFPHSVLVAPHGLFTVSMPPERVPA